MEILEKDITSVFPNKKLRAKTLYKTLKQPCIDDIKVNPSCKAGYINLCEKGENSIRFDKKSAYLY